jgi:hypothetical protein
MGMQCVVHIAGTRETRNAYRILDRNPLVIQIRIWEDNIKMDMCVEKVSNMGG